MAYDQNTALTILQYRLDRGGMAVPVALREYWLTRLDAGEAELARKGIHLQDTVNDNTLLADFVAWKLKNRDKSGGMPDWMRLELRERWITERRSTTDDTG